VYSGAITDSYRLYRLFDTVESNYDSFINRINESNLEEKN
jgi:hypothetical protein